MKTFEMDCTVIVPVGPGHMPLAEKAMQSVVWALEYGKGAFDQVHVIVGDDTKGEIGRSKARNRMVERHESWMGVFGEKDDMAGPFESEWLFFLDADDLMCSPKTYGESAFKVVAPYLNDYDCIWGTIHEMDKKGVISKRMQTDRITTYKAYVRTQPALSCQMGHFVRRDKFPGFDEDLDVCEDVDLYLREWKDLRCIKQEKPLFLNRRGFHSWMMEEKKGRKTHTGLDWSMKAEEMLKEARKKL